MGVYTFFVTNGGAPASGLAPSIIVWRGADGTASGVAAPAIAEIDAVNAPGWYRFTVTPDKQIVVTVDADPGAVVGIPAAERYIPLQVTPDDFAVTEARMQAIRASVTQGAYRLKDLTHSAIGKLTAGTLRLYANAADAAADVNPIAEVTIAATYDDDGNLTSYLGTEI